VGNAAAGSMSLLRTDALTMRFAGLVALDVVDLAVAAGSIHALIGPNGAGKTTMFNLISGLMPPTAGAINLDSADITALPAYARAALGMARSFQNIRIFASMTVLENVLTGLHAAIAPGLIGTLLRRPAFRRQESDAVARARAALDLVGLTARADDRAAALAYGDQRRLEIARAVVGKPRLLLLDEPAAGMNPAEGATLSDLIRRIRDAGTTVLLVEHDMGFVMRLADQVTVLNFGRRIAEGTPAEIRRDPTVITAYLGAKVAARLNAA
jgi:branched-chain amino acid transport system ATP-binding protein